MIIDITTGFFPCTGHKPGCPWPCVADNGARDCSYVSSIWTCEGHGGPASTAASGEQTVVGVGLLTESSYSPSHLGIPCDQTCAAGTTAACTHNCWNIKNPIIACSKSVSVCTADLPSVKKQSAKRRRGGGALLTHSILSLNNISVFCRQMGFWLHIKCSQYFSLLWFLFVPFLSCWLG